MMSARERDKIPHPATWLRGQRWRDEIEADKPTAAARAYKHAWEADR
jgi:hypothetical protein